MRATLDGRILWRTETRLCVRCGGAFEAQHGRKGRAPSHCLDCRMHPPAKRLTRAGREPVLAVHHDGERFVIEVWCKQLEDAQRIAARIKQEILGC